MAQAAWYDVDPRDLRIFRAVIRAGSFTRAAGAVHVSQPRVSVAIGRLERALAVPLFERLGRGKRLTEAGRTLGQLVGDLLAAWEALPARLAESLTGEPQGELRIGAGESAVLYLLPPAVERLRKRYPTLRVTVRNQPVADTVAMLRSGELDVGLRSLASTPRGLIYERWRRFDRVLIARRGHPVLRRPRLTAGDLAGCDWVMPWSFSTTRQRVEQVLAEAGVECRVVLEAGGWEVVKRYVAIGAGIAVVPSFCVLGGDGKVLGARPVTHLFGDDGYGLLVRRGRQVGRAAQELLRIISPQTTLLGTRT